jgi:chromate reductase
MKLLAFAATSSIHSINKQVIAYAGRLLEDGLVDDVTVETIDLNDFEMPIYSIDRQNADGIPQEAQNFFDAIGSADAVIVSFAEHNGFYTSAYKNIFDWASRIDMKVYQDKPAVLFATSGGPGGGGNVLNIAVMSGQFFGYDVKASLSIPTFN